MKNPLKHGKRVYVVSRKIVERIVNAHECVSEKCAHVLEITRIAIKSLMGSKTPSSGKKRAPQWEMQRP